MRINEDYIDDLKDVDISKNVDKELDEDIYEEVSKSVQQLIKGENPDIVLVRLPDAYYKPVSSYELKRICIMTPKKYGDRCNLNWVDISNFRELDDLFYKNKFNGDISRWNTSNVISMYDMFKESSFNGDISKWNVSNVRNMDGMFYYSKFNGDISNWDVSRVENMDYMFAQCPFTGDISKWNLKSLESNNHMVSYDMVDYVKLPPGLRIQRR